MSFIPWLLFFAIVTVLLVLDLGVFHRKAHVIAIREALWWTAFWITLAMLFNVLIYYMYENHWFGVGLHAGSVENGKDTALQFLTGYIIEKSLSVDNIFVIAMVFSYFRVPPQYQHRVLFWGIVGAIIMRGAMIWLGVALITRFLWMNYVFGGILILTAVKMLISKQENLDPQRNPIYRFATEYFPISSEYNGQRFLTTMNGKLALTPLFLVLIIVESTDLLFAIDSIPAIFAVTRDPFIVLTSNIFAILGLRSLYFALAGLMDKFQYLKVSLVFLLAFVGVKMIIAHHYPIPTVVSLGIIAGILSVGIIASLVPKKE